MLSAAKHLSRYAQRYFAALSMTGRDLFVDEDLSSSFEPCLNKLIRISEKPPRPIMSFNKLIWVCGGFPTGRYIGGGREKSSPTGGSCAAHKSNTPCHPTNQFSFDIHPSYTTKPTY